MICADTNVFVEFFRGINRTETMILQKALEDKRLIMNPFVLSELLSSPRLTKKIEKYLSSLDRLDIDRDFFYRAGLLRRTIYLQGKGVPIADIYIAQACIDATIPLLSIDQDIIMISEHSDLELVQFH